MIVAIIPCCTENSLPCFHDDLDTSTTLIASMCMLQCQCSSCCAGINFRGWNFLRLRSHENKTQHPTNITHHKVIHVHSVPTTYEIQNIMLDSGYHYSILLYTVFRTPQHQREIDAWNMPYTVTRAERLGCIVYVRCVRLSDLVFLIWSSTEIGSGCKELNYVVHISCLHVSQRNNDTCSRLVECILYSAIGQLFEVV